MKKSGKHENLEKRRKKGIKNCTSFNTPKMKYNMLVYVPTEAAPSTAPTPDRTAAPSTYLYYIMIICLICE